MKQLLMGLAIVLMPCAALSATLVSVTSTSLTSTSWGTEHRDYVYQWIMNSGTTCTVRARCYKGSSDERWSLTLPDGFAVGGLGHRDWQKDIGIYTGDEVLTVLEQTLKNFQSREPTATFSEVNFGIEHVKELWDEFARAFGNRVKKIGGESEGGHFHTLRPIASEVLQKNTYVVKITGVLKKFGYNVSGEISHDGEKSPNIEQGQWAELVARPDLGLTHIGYLSIKVSK